MGSFYVAGTLRLGSVSLAAIGGGANLPITTQPSNYTLQPLDDTSGIRSTSTSPVTWMLPNYLPVGWNVVIIQAGAGKVTVANAAGATLQNRSGFFGTAGQFSEISLVVDSNVGGTAAEYVLSGDTG